MAVSSHTRLPVKYSISSIISCIPKKLLGPHSVSGIYGCPCNACSAQACLCAKPCASPALQTQALESLGICVERICNDLADLTGNTSWRLRWLKHFGLPQQTPKTWKYVQAISVKLP